MGFVVFILVLFFIIKKINSVKTMKQDGVKILNMMHLGSKQRLILVEVNETTLLLGATEHQIQKLHKFKKREDSLRN
jgi:flagellar protein FliO/FliZ